MNILHFDKLESTNKYAKEEAKKGAAENTVIIADTQTQGYGRLNRHFCSPDKSGLYMSIILRPHIKPEECLLITTAAAVAVSNAIEQISNVKTGIKWVNDIYVDKKKVCGILTETGFSDKAMLDYAVLGIGVNIYTPEGGFPSEIRNIAGSIFDTPQSNDVRFKLTDLIINEFQAFYRNITDKPHLCSYKEKSLVTGRKITVIRGNEHYQAEVIGIDDDFRLLIKDSNNKIIALESGEISIRM